MKMIDELWYGNVSPFEQCTRGDKRLKELLKLVARNREERMAHLPMKVICTSGTGVEPQFQNLVSDF